MSIFHRLQLTGFILIILLFVLSSYFIITSYLNFEKVTSFKTTLKMNALTNETLLNIDKERGLTALYLGSDKQEFITSLHKQRKNLDENFKKLENNGQKLFQGTTQLSSIRKDIDTKNSNFQEIFFDYYTKKLSIPILQKLYDIQNYTLTPEISTLISSLISIYTSQEYSSRERGFVSYYLMKKSPMSTQQISIWENFRYRANSYHLTSIYHHDLYQNIFHTKNAKNIMHELSSLSCKIQKNINNGNYLQSATHWFTQQTNKITLLNKAQLLISNTLWKESNIYLKKQLLLLSIAGFMWLLSIILGYLYYKTIRDIKANLKKLEHILNTAITQVQKKDTKINSKLKSITHIKLSSKNGIKKAYEFLETLIETAKEDKRIALQSNEAKSLFLANMSHEIRTPLNGIVGFTEILRSTNLDEEQTEFLSIIDKSSENLLNIINNILDLSKIENHKTKVESIVFNAQIEFENAIETYAVLAADKNIDLNFYMDPNIASKLKGDPTKIKEVLINLLSNAIKFTGYNGEINLDITKKSHKDNLIHFLIHDNGIGMTEEQQSLIFDAFSQADVSVPRKYGGTGLGLTISSKFVEIMGGTLELQSTKEQGTAFFFSLPLEEVSSTIKYNHKTFPAISIGKYTQDLSYKLDDNLEKYFNFYNLTIKHFKTVKTLLELEKENQCKSYWIDIDKADENILNTLKHIDKSKLIIIANITSRKKVELLGINQKNIIYKPLTLTKFKNTLHHDKTLHSISQLPIKIKSIQFNAYVLVTEDNTINQKLIQRILEIYGIKVDLAKNGLESLEKYQNNRYDLIFMDIQMPVMNGIETTHKILNYEKEKSLSHVPIVALTANALKGDKEKFLAEGMDAYIAKPIETTELLYILYKFLNKSTQTKIKKILIAKEIILEQKVLIKVIENLGYDYDTLVDISEIETHLKSQQYDIVFTDSNLIVDIQPSSYLETSIITETKSKSEIETFIRQKRAKTSML